ncbi:hypothetical protein K501DRAFT_312756, partial [Backusella circina FSU 941]
MRKKSQLTPSQHLSHLGMIIDTTNMTFTVQGKKIRSIRRSAYKLLYQSSTTWTNLSRFIGSAMATYLGNVQARYRTRRLLQ